MVCMVPRNLLGVPISPQTLTENCFTRIFPKPENPGGPRGPLGGWPIVPLWAIGLYNSRATHPRGPTSTRCMIAWVLVYYPGCALGVKLLVQCHQREGSTTVSPSSTTALTTLGAQRLTVIHMDSPREGFYKDFPQIRKASGPPWAHGWVAYCPFVGHWPIQLPSHPPAWAY